MLVNRNQADKSSDDEDAETITKKKKTNVGDIGGLKTDALQAGKWFAVCNSLWVDPASIKHISTLVNPADPASDEPDELWEQAEAIFKSLPGSLHPHVGTKWFRECAGIQCYLKY